MGKKRIIAKSESELKKEEAEGEIKKGPEVKTLHRAREGRIYIASSYNNTILTLTDRKGNMLAWTSAGRLGFKGAKKATPFAASKVAESLVETAKKMGVEEVEIFVKGIGSGRESAVRSLASRGLDVVSIKDITPVPHNGCRPPKPRRG